MESCYKLSLVWDHRLNKEFRAVRATPLCRDLVLGDSILTSVTSDL